MQELPVVALGCLLHDIGKIIQRADENPMTRSHSRFGSEFLEKSGLTDANPYWRWVVESVKYHHWKDIKNGHASLPIAWFAFEADNLSSAHDRKLALNCVDLDGNRIEETDISQKGDWDRFRRLDSIFTLFRSPDGKAETATKLPLWFRRVREGERVREIYPYPESADKEADAVQNYQILRDRVLTDLFAYLKGKDPTSLETVNSVLHYLEENLSMVPPDTYTGHTNDVSLYDHLKLTAAIGTCMYSYVAEAHSDWLEKSGQKIPWDRGFRKEKSYLILKSDISGIQEFIYNISSKAALKGLRGRSFYLELLQTEIAEHLLAAMNLSRANLLYQGGGGFAILAPNTRAARDVVERTRSEFNRWLFEHFRTRLFLALEYAEASGEQLRGGAGADGESLATTWRQISKRLAASKAERFRELLPQVFQPREFVAECRICYRDDAEVVSLSSDGDGETLQVCRLCRDLVELGGRLPQCAARESGGQAAELILQAAGGREGTLPRWSGSDGLTESWHVRIDSGGGKETERYVLHNLDCFRPPRLFWSLTKFKNNEFGDLAEAAEGVRRIAVLRADVDNLGKVFSGQDESIGLPPELRSISRDATLSRSLARFFTHYLDDLLSQPRPGGAGGEKWAITTVYAGGDDLFLVGAWDQVLEFALLFHEKFARFTCGKLTLSAGVSIHKPRYPLYRMAEDAALAEHTAKKSGKNALCVYFDDRIQLKHAAHTFGWEKWTEKIVPLVGELTYLSGECGLSAGYWNFLLNFMRSDDASFYKLLYNTARLEERAPRLRDDERWMSFKRQWIVAPGSDRAAKEPARLLETALNWFILLERESGRDDEGAVKKARGGSGVTR